ncbi:MAG: class I SAM-dependent methyltransferase, partial [Deltaproteobacteria bacterium]|nr:class I SAM-dependent methyltransferase [Deltaproteobacteria bacterium]
PSSAELADNYEDYLPVDPGEIAAWDRMMKPVIDSSIRVISERAGSQRGRVLDIGCGFGFFLREMKNRGWQAEGVEISPAGSRYTRDMLDVPVHVHPLEELELADDVFDVVTLFYVIEHVPDPIKLLKEVNRILKPGGLVLLRWPHSTPIVRLLGRLSENLDLYHTPYHLYDFSPATMNALLRRTGFRRIETVIGGFTKPPQVAYRIASLVFGGLAEVLCRLSHGTVMLPGVSKTTTAFAGR